MFSYLLIIVAAIGTVASTVFLAMALASAVRHKLKMAAQRAEGERVTEFPPVSVLKPVHGMEPRLRENLESYFQQDHTEFELIFCARTRDDAALKLVDELCALHPKVNVRIMTSGEPSCPNAKVFSVEKMVAESKYHLLVISDSDVHVAPGYLRDITHPPLKQEVGMVTCLYRGYPVGGLWARLEALGMSVEMTSGVLIANMLEGMKFALGPTMVIRKDVLAKIGGIGQLRDYCSDDYLLGKWTEAAGYQVLISEHVIDHIVLNRSWSSSWAHQVRWMKSTRFSRPVGHLGTGLTFAMPFGILGLIAGCLAGQPALGAALFAWAVLSRFLQALAIGWGVVRDPRALSHFWLYPARDLLGFFLWVASYSGSVVDWRGEKYRLQSGGIMTKVG